MTIRHCFTASLLFCVFAAAALAQGTGNRTSILTGFVPLSEQQLQEGYVRIFDNTTTFGWKGIAMINAGKLNFTGRVVDTPLYFLGYGSVPWNNMSGTDTAKPQGTMTPLFDGTTLKGWTIRGDSKAIVENGTIKLTGGSGSLESDGKYADFILQLEYKTDKVVNSGVFFRSIPGQTMNGYECQILNNPGENDYKNYIGTDTGGIFRRQNGRNVGPKDGEWNYMTISARGPRVATWVNGIQVTDWTDPRPPHDNPRNGLRTEAGTIQFQGHDAGTEIWFRNIRIVEL